ncbi:Leukotoxin (plasmid) [Sulfitobacter sp. DSM 110093]|nr:Leukotoxin [Sulfitobacter sp. DSM 110093]
MPNVAQNNVFAVVGTKLDDSLTDLNFAVPKAPTAIEAFKVNGLEGGDTLVSYKTSDLAAGDMVGDEWSFENGKWVYDAKAVIVSGYGADSSFDDFISTGNGDDVLLGNGGNDVLYAGAGNDILNGGNGHEQAFGGYGDDLINLEEGNDWAEGGFGNDTVNAGNGDDIVYGDVKGDNLLENTATLATTFSQLAQNGAWTMADSFGQSEISQSVATVAGESYTISFDLAANLDGGHATGHVEVLWNGQV